MSSGNGKQDRPLAAASRRLRGLPKRRPLPAKKDVKPYTLRSLIEYRAEGLTLVQIAKLYGVTKQAIQQRLGRALALLDKDRVEVFRERRGELLSAIELELLARLAESHTLREMSGLQLATSFGILYDKERLEAGKSTMNLSIAQIVEQLHRERPLPAAPEEEPAGEGPEAQEAGP